MVENVLAEVKLKVEFALSFLDLELEVLGFVRVKLDPRIKQIFLNDLSAVSHVLQRLQFLLFLLGWVSIVSFVLALRIRVDLDGKLNANLALAFAESFVISAFYRV